MNASADVRPSASPLANPWVQLILGVICVVLLLIVYLGHRAKGKHVLRVKNLQNAKS